MKRELTTFKIVITMFLIAMAFSILFVVQANAQATFSAATNFTIPANPQDMVTADLNNDGKPDFATVHNSTNNFSVFMNTTASGAATASFTGPTTFSTGSSPYGITCGDINKDGKIDMILYPIGTGNVEVYINTTPIGNATPTFSAAASFSAGGTFPANGLAADINNDGKPDVLSVQNAGSSFSVLLNTTVVNAATPTFSAAVTFATPSSNPNRLAVGDFNRDGKVDVAVVNGTNFISVYINTTTVNASTPTFAAKVDFATNSTPRDITIVDVNRDGKVDMLVANQLASNFSVFINTTTQNSTTPSFASKTDFTAAGNTFFMKSADFNGDGKPDMLTGGINGSLSLFLDTTAAGSSTPNFHTRIDLTSGLTSSVQAGIADINTDGKPDIIVCGSQSKVTAMINTSTTGSSSLTLGTPDEIPTGNRPYMVCIADFNLDGKPDLATGSFAPALSVMISVTPLGGNFSNYFDPVNFSTSTNVGYVCAGDFNLDGKPDVVYSLVSSSTISVRLNTTTPGSTTPTFSGITNLTALTNGFFLNVRDVNGDGKPDIISSSTTASTVSVFLNTTTPGASTPTFSSRTDLTAPGSTNGLCSADFNGDGKPDIATCSSLIDFMSVYFNTTTPGASTPTFGIRADFTTAAAPNTICCGDLNGDGKPDIVTANNASNISVFFNTTTAGASTPTFSSKTDFAVNQFVKGLCLCDMNGDGKLDVIITSLGATSFSIYLNNTPAGASTPTFASRMDVPITFSSNYASTGDINLDGRQDLAIANFDPSGSAFIYLNTSVIPLPVELSSFTSTVDKQNVTLNWSTVQEENNKGFEIERNSFGAGWKKIGYVEGHGTTNTPQNYTYKDNSLNTGRYSYRLKQIDYNGNFEYYELSNEVAIGVPTRYSLSQNYPNPFNPATRINYNLPIDSKVQIKIFDMTGREVYQLLNESMNAGYYTAQFNGTNLASGVYFYQIIANGGKQTFTKSMKMVLVK